MDTKLKTVIVADNSRITGLGMGGFQGSASLEVVDFGENSSITTIPESAFVGTKIQSIALPDGVNIGKQAFWNLTTLKAVEIGANAVIGESAFNGCTSLENITLGDNVTLGTSCFFNADKVTQVIIPAGTTAIGASAFNGCDMLTTVNIPESVTDIYYRAFRACPLTTINYDGTIEQWNAINKISGWDEGVTTSYTVICSDGNITD